MWLGIDWGDWIALAALALSALVAVVGGSRSVARSRRERREATEREVAAQADAVTIWVEDHASRGQEVVVRNGSHHPISYVVIALSPASAPIKGDGTVSPEYIPVRSIGPTRGYRSIVTLMSPHGPLLAVASVRFVDRNGQGWQVDGDSRPEKVDHDHTIHAFFATGSRAGWSSPMESDWFGESLDSQSRSAAGPMADRVRLPVGSGHSLTIPLMEPGTVLTYDREHQVLQDDMHRATVRLTKDERLVEIVLVNLPNPLRPDGTLPEGGVEPFPYEDGSVLLAFNGAHPREVAETLRSGYEIPSGVTGEPIAKTYFDAEGQPLGILVLDAKKTLTPWLHPDPNWPVVEGER